jgi:hypothetical protein
LDTCSLTNVVSVSNIIWKLQIHNSVSRLHLDDDDDDDDYSYSYYNTRRYLINNLYVVRCRLLTRRTISKMMKTGSAGRC